jgi:hypothetical protein
MNPKQMHIVIVGNAKQIAKGLDKYGPVKYFDIEGNEVAAPVEAKADASLTPAVLMDKVIAALGGQTALNSVKDIQYKGKAALMGREIEMNQTKVLPGNAIITMTMGGMVVSKQAVVNGKYSVAQQGMEAPITDDLKESLNETASLHPETIFIKNGYKLKIAGADKIEGADVIDLEVTTPSGKVSHRYYDSKTFLLAKVATTQEVPGRGAVTQQQFFKDYKSIGGVQIANEEVLDLGQFKLNVKYSDIKVNQGLKAEDLK